MGDLESISESLHKYSLPELRPVFRSLLSLDDLSSLNDSEKVGIIGILVDLSEDLDSANGAKKAIQWAEDLSTRCCLVKASQLISEV